MILALVLVGLGAWLVYDKFGKKDNGARVNARRQKQLTRQYEDGAANGAYGNDIPNHWPSGRGRSSGGSGRGVCGMPTIQWGTGTQIQALGHDEIYLVYSGVLRHLNMADHKSLLQRGVDVTRVPEAILNDIPMGLPMEYEGHTISSGAGYIPGREATKHIWFLSNGRKYRVRSPQDLIQLGQQGQEIRVTGDGVRMLENMPGNENDVVGAFEMIAFSRKANANLLDTVANAVTSGVSSVWSTATSLFRL